MNCKHCKKKIPPYKGNRPKEFCNSTCRSNHWYAVNKKGKSKEAGGGLPLPVDYVDTNESGMAMIHPDGTKEPLIVYKKAGKKAFDGKKRDKVFDEFAMGVDPFKKGKSKARVTVTDLTKPTGKKVVSDPPPKENYSINTKGKGGGKKESDYILKRRQSKQ